MVWHDVFFCRICEHKKSHPSLDGVRSSAVLWEVCLMDEGSVNPVPTWQPPFVAGSEPVQQIAGRLSCRVRSAKLVRGQDRGEKRQARNSHAASHPMNGGTAAEARNRTNAICGPRIGSSQTMRRFNPISAHAAM